MTAAPRSPVRSIAVTVLALKGHDLGNWLLLEREKGHSYRTIARHLADFTTGLIDVTDVTIAKWVADATPTKKGPA